ncbi:hypothetical protein BJAS_P3476 [Bathymodiolus japonicus methanotrophic gill symbiont]|uniref:RHS repeat-associated core domain-containing protein n=1 Tax=Bathymodiolus japonicus methanotrophic gill symbiont TaxID=113269 RepID=UPI001B3E56BF|nr:RHS repeat-associated core domain-containing protein [Bathymodiolus japonicus methanotrophic gill symbiont]GFO72939.1 hypothetical protein BJAS_P3476 [Bathymodiolus japonicus methanotrophic gill symbiont]
MKVLAYLLIASITLLPFKSYSSPRFIDRDHTNNVYHLDHRHYSLLTGRFLTQDPKKQYSSHYAYGSGDVIAHSDPTGLFNIEEFTQVFQDLLNEAGQDKANAIMENVVKLMPEIDSKLLSNSPDIIVTSNMLYVNPYAEGVYIYPHFKADHPEDMTIRNPEKVKVTITKTVEPQHGRIILGVVIGALAIGGTVGIILAALDLKSL